MNNKKNNKGLIMTKLMQVMLLVLSGLLTACGGSSYTSQADNNQVVTLGDSIFDLSDKLQGNLERYAGQTFRKYTLNGAQLSNDGIGVTPVVGQYAQAKSDNADIQTIVMNGGGNDILIPVVAQFDPYRCKTRWYQFGQLSSKCQNFIDDLYVESVDILNDMDNDGVENVIYLGYYYTKNALLPLKSLKQAVDYGNNILARACVNSTVDCTFINPSSSIVNRDIILDGIHPASSGSRKLADLIWPHLEPLL
jgi:lysophospholipase L1-like esterase